MTRTRSKDRIIVGTDIRVKGNITKLQRRLQRGQRMEESRFGLEQQTKISLFDRVNEVIEEDKKLPETKRKELEYLQAHPWETEESS